MSDWKPWAEIYDLKFDIPTRCLVKETLSGNACIIEISSSFEEGQELKHLEGDVIRVDNFNLNHVFFIVLDNPPVKDGPYRRIHVEKI